MVSLRLRSVTGYRRVCFLFSAMLSDRLSPCLFYFFDYVLAPVKLSKWLSKMTERISKIDPNESPETERSRSFQFTDSLDKSSTPHLFFHNRNDHVICLSDLARIQNKLDELNNHPNAVGVEQHPDIFLQKI